MSLRYHIILFVLFVALAVPASARADALRCPNNNGSHALTNTTVFNSSSGEMSDVPEEDDGWNLAEYEPDERNFYIVCHYEGTDDTKEIFVPPTVASCQEDGKNIKCN